MFRFLFSSTCMLVLHLFPSSNLLERPWKEGGKVESIKNVERTSHTQKDDMAHDMKAYDDVATYLAK